jgi:FtsZ-binding cell division protein ZapB
MRLLLDTLRSLVGTALRFCALLSVLFAVHLVVTRAVPEVSRTVAVLEEEPRVTAELKELSTKLDQEQKDAALLEGRLREATRAHVSVLRASIDRWQHRMQQLRAEQQHLAQQLTDIAAEQSRYCDTYNPFKLWFCRRVRERTTGLRAALTPLANQVAESLREGDAALSNARHRLEMLEKGDVEALGPQGAGLAARIEESRQRARVLASELRDARQRRARLLRVVHSPLGWVVREWRAVWLRLVFIVLVVALLPYAQRTLAYWVLMPIAERARALRLADTHLHAALRIAPAQRSMTVPLQPGESLSVRAGYARPIQGRATSQLLYRWTSPFVSYAAGLSLLTRLDADATSTDATSVTLSSEAPEIYLMRIDLEDHPGVAFHPRHLVGVLGAPELRTVWRILSWHAWATGQLRYILLCGTGGCILEGRGDIVAHTLAESRAKIEQQLVVAFDTRLGYKTARTETFLPYLLGRTPLVDDVFEGSGSYFWQKNPAGRAQSALQRGFDVLFGAIGKLLGF